MIKKFLIGTFAVAALAFAMSASAAYDFGTTTLKVGSKGEAVKNLQMVVGATVDGSFGPKTKAKVMAWQANNGLTADGLFGNASKAKANGAVSGNFPAGCTSASGYSTTTGQACVALPSTPAVAGCPAGALFNSQTGASCTTTTGPLVGGAGSATVTELSSPSASTKVGEGEVATKVYGVEVEADDSSDLAINSMKITLSNGGTGSKKLDRYAKSVSVWYNSEKVGSADVSSFSETSNVYSKSIPVSNVVIKAGQKGKIYFAVDALTDIDSGNTGSTYNTWTITVTSTRYTDATGVVSTDTTGSLANTFIFDTLANTGDVELKVGLSSSNRKAETIKVSTTSDTSKVELLKFTLKAQNSAMAIDQVPVLFTTDETDLDQVTSNVILAIDGQEFSETLTTSAASTATIDFNNLGLTLDAGETLTGTVYADIQDIETSTFDEGTTLKAEITSALVAAVSGDYIDVEDSNGDQLATGDRTGSANGDTMTFRSTGVNVALGTVSYDKTVDSSGNITSTTYVIPVTVTSFGNTLYVGQTAQLAATATASNAFAYVFQNSSAPTTSDVNATASSTLSSSDAVLESNGYRLDDGIAKHFTITVNLTTPVTGNNSYRVAIKQLRTFTESGLGLGASNSSLTPVESYQTDYKLITS